LQAVESQVPRSQGQASQLTRSYYEANAERYAAVAAKAPMSSLVASFAEQLPAGSLVLDLGCGSGRDLQGLGSRGLRPIGLDYAESLARLALAGTGLPVVVADVRQLPVKGGSVDGAWAAACLHHLQRPELLSALREIRRVLRPGAPFFASMKEGMGEGYDAAGRWFTYVQRPDWEHTLREAGFVAVEVRRDRENQARPGSSEPVDWLVSFAHSPYRSRALGGPRRALP